MFCANCGAMLSDGAAFCTNCGSPVASVPVTPMQPVPEPAVMPIVEPTPVQVINPVPMQPAEPVMAPVVEAAPEYQAAPIAEMPAVDDDETPTMPLFTTAPESVVMPVAEEIPVVQEAAPIVEEIPVVQEAAPIVEEIPVIQEAAPIVEEIPVIQEAAPIVEEIPVVQEAAPIVEEIPTVQEAAPVVEEIPAVQEAVPVAEEILEPTENAIFGETQKAMDSAIELAPDETVTAPIMNSMPGNNYANTAAFAGGAAYTGAGNMQNQTNYDQNINNQSMQYGQSGQSFIQQPYAQPQQSYQQTYQQSYQPTEPAYVNTMNQKNTKEVDTDNVAYKAAWAAGGNPMMLVFGIVGVLYLVLLFIKQYIPSFQGMGQAYDYMPGQVAALNTLSVIISLVTGFLPLFFMVLGAVLVFCTSKAKSLTRVGHGFMKAATVINIVVLSVMSLIMAIGLGASYWAVATAQSYANGFSGLFGGYGQSYVDQAAGTVWVSLIITTVLVITFIVLAFIWYSKLMRSINVMARSLRVGVIPEKPMSVYVIVIQWMIIALEIIAIAIILPIALKNGGFGGRFVMPSISINGMSIGVPGMGIDMEGTLMMIGCKVLYDIFFVLGFTLARSRMRNVR
ncbi:MAG: zinc-ribbon domain-containing protein [Lachnospiraceae bacterium]|nr:zinc-ribbon domain-containing protein [Candidatus Merdinaster equi]